MKLTIALLLASVPFLALGAEGLYRAATSRQQTVLTCGDLAAQPPSGSWVKITGCELDYDNGAGMTREDGQVTELSFPVRPAGAPAAAPALLVAATRDPAVLAIAQSALDSSAAPDQEARTVMMLRIVTALRAAREIEGSIRGGLLEGTRTAETIASVKTPVAADALVIDLNERPESGVAAAFAGAGFACLVAGLVFATGGRGQKQKAPEALNESVIPESTEAGPPIAFDEPAPSAPAGAAASAGGSRLRKLMLLNLSADAGRGAIEDAPPLGDRLEVERKITEALPGITFDGSGRGTLTLPGTAVAIDLGRSAVTWTAVLDAEGMGAGEVIHALVRGTGWRIYQPKRGDFLDINHLERL